MLTLLFFIFLIAIFGRIFFLGLKLTWGIFKIALTVFLMPVILIGLVFSGLFTVALVLLIICGIVSLFIPTA